MTRVVPAWLMTAAVITGFMAGWVNGWMVASHHRPAPAVTAPARPAPVCVTWEAVRIGAVSCTQWAQP
jgi:hypothetical protein